MTAPSSPSRNCDQATPRPASPGRHHLAEGGERSPHAIAFDRGAGHEDVATHTFVVGTDPQTDRILTRSVIDAAD